MGLQSVAPRDLKMECNSPLVSPMETLQLRFLAEPAQTDEAFRVTSLPGPRVLGQPADSKHRKHSRRIPLFAWFLAGIACAEGAWSTGFPNVIARFVNESLLLPKGWPADPESIQPHTTSGVNAGTNTIHPTSQLLLEFQIQPPGISAAPWLPHDDRASRPLPIDCSFVPLTNHVAASAPQANQWRAFVMTDAVDEMSLRQSVSFQGNPISNLPALATKSDAELVKLLASVRPRMRQAAQAELATRGWTQGSVELASELAVASADHRLQLMGVLLHQSEINPRPWLLWMAEEGQVEVRIAAVECLAEVMDLESRERLRRILDREQSVAVRQVISTALEGARTSLPGGNRR